jgi:hypothetical protein
MRLATTARLFLLLVMMAPISNARQPSTAPEPKIETVSLCELIKSWKKYDHKIVRIEAIYTIGAESSQVYDIGCLTSYTAWVPPDIESATPADLRDKLKRLVKPGGRARIVAVGEFDGPKKVDIPAGTSPGLADTLRAANSHYGHMNGWNFQFVVSKIEKVEAVPARDPWPHRASGKEQ